MAFRTYIGIAVAVAVGVIVTVLVLKVTNVIDGNSKADERAAYRKCVQALAPWRDPANYCGDNPGGWGGGGWGGGGWGGGGW